MNTNSNSFWSILPQAQDQCFINPMEKPIELLKIPGVTSSLVLFLFSNLFQKSAGMLTNISVQPTAAWRQPISNYEAIFMGLIYVKAMALRFLTILPISLNNVGLSEWENYRSFNKRSTHSSTIGSDLKVLNKKRRIMDTLLGIIRRLDENDCLLRTLCELQSASLNGHKLPYEMKLTLSALSQSGWKRNEENTEKTEKFSQDIVDPPEFIEERPVISIFEEAVLIGWESQNKNKNSTDCSQRYSLCPLNNEEIFEHFEKIKHINVLPSKF